MRRIRERRADRMKRYEELSRSWVRYFDPSKMMTSTEIHLQMYKFWLQSERHSLDFHARNS